MVVFPSGVLSIGQTGYWLIAARLQTDLGNEAVHWEILGKETASSEITYINQKFDGMSSN